MDKLTKGVSSKQWKYLKVKCKPFNTEKPFGLARLRVFPTAPSAEFIAATVASNQAVQENMNEILNAQKAQEEPPEEKQKPKASVVVHHSPVFIYNSHNRVT